MDIYEYLKMDHDHVAHLFKQFSKTQSKDRRKQIAEFIILELEAHARSEQDTFYKILLDYEKTKEDAVHGKKEHQEIEDQIALIKESKDFGQTFVNRVEKLQKIVDHHVKDEEGPLFRKAKKVLSEQEAYIIKEQMHFLKQKLLRSLEKRKIYS